MLIVRNAANREVVRYTTTPHMSVHPCSQQIQASQLGLAEEDRAFGCQARGLAIWGFAIARSRCRQGDWLGAVLSGGMLST